MSHCRDALFEASLHLWFQALLLSLFFVFISNLPTYVALSTLKCTFSNLKPIKNVQKK